MRIVANYKKDFNQYFPILLFKDGESKVLMFGFGNKNISFVSDKPDYDVKFSNGGQLNDKDEKVYFLVWYKKIVNGDKTHYTQPFRTKVYAYNIGQAKERLEKAISKRMELVMVEENEYNTSDLRRMHSQFRGVDALMKEMDDAVKKYNDKFISF
jgi:hypothetical protein